MLSQSIATKGLGVAGGQSTAIATYGYIHVQLDEQPPAVIDPFDVLHITQLVPGMSVRVVLYGGRHIQAPTQGYKVKPVYKPAPKSQSMKPGRGARTWFFGRLIQNNTTTGTLTVDFQEHNRKHARAIVQYGDIMYIQRILTDAVPYINMTNPLRPGTKALGMIQPLRTPTVVKVKI